jgi:LmbE family N-acetylglucosaminyl deacetylase
MTPTALALSPHLDDAVFSCGGTLATLARSGWRVVVATLFTRSVLDPVGFALACQLDKGLDASVDYMALRRAEDADACAQLGVEPRWMPLPEAPHRGYETAAALFGPVLIADAVGELVRPAIRDLLDTLQPDLVLAPQAIGGHVDHVVVAQALRETAPPMPVLWWQDFPYAVRQSSVRSVFSDDMALVPELSVRVPLEPKLGACAAYASQLGFQFGGRMSLGTMLSEGGSAERFRSDRLEMVPAVLLDPVTVSRNLKK